MISVRGLIRPQFEATAEVLIERNAPTLSTTLAFEGQRVPQLLTKRRKLIQTNLPSNNIHSNQFLALEYIVTSTQTQWRLRPRV